MYQIRDVVAACLVGPILLERNDAPAVRMFYAAFEDAKSALSANPKDYELMALGEYDDEVGVIETCFDRIASGVDYIKEKERANASA